MFKTRYQHKEVTQLVNSLPSETEPMLVPSLMDYIINYQGNSNFEGYDLDELSEDAEVIEDFTDLRKEMNEREPNAVRGTIVKNPSEAVKVDNEEKEVSDDAMSVSEGD